MLYNDSNLQYDDSRALYDGSWVLTIAETSTYTEQHTKLLSSIIAESIILTEKITARYDILLSDISNIYENTLFNISTLIHEVVTHVDTFKSYIIIKITDTLNLTEKITSMFKVLFVETITISELYFSVILTSFNDAATYTEKLYSKICKLLTESITTVEVKVFKIFAIILDTSTYTEPAILEAFERLVGAIGMIKEFVGIGKSKEQVSAINVGVGEYETLNNPLRLYDESSVMYDAIDVCYNNYISSEKPVSAISKSKEPVTISNDEDKPMISKV